MNKIKRFLRNASIGFHMFFMFLCTLLICGAAWICVNASELLSAVLLIVIMLMVIIDAYYAVRKTAENCICKYERTLFCEIEKFLSSEYTRIYVFSSSKLDKSLTYYGKIDLDGTIIIYGEDKSGNTAYHHWDKNYVWFMENFYVM